MTCLQFLASHKFLMLNKLEFPTPISKPRSQSPAVLCWFQDHVLSFFSENFRTSLRWFSNRSDIRPHFRLENTNSIKNVAIRSNFLHRFCFRSKNNGILTSWKANTQRLISLFLLSVLKKLFDITSLKSYDVAYAKQETIITMLSLI